MFAGYPTSAGPPIHLPGPEPGPAWERMRRALGDNGAVVVYGWLPAWIPTPASLPRLRERLGRDWRRYQALRQPRLRERFAAARLLLRSAAAAAMETTPELIDLAYQPGGRPYLRGCDQIDINLSHTGDIIVVGMNRSGRIGVDVERADRSMVGGGAESRACTPFERRQLRRLSRAERNAELLQVWTLKEAYSKAIGQGLRFRFTEFGFDLGAPVIRLVRPDGSRTVDERWMFHTWLVEGSYVVSGAVHATDYGEAADIRAGTTLDDGLLDALLSAVGRTLADQPAEP